MTSTTTNNLNDWDYEASYRGMAVTITGGAGFIGSHLAHRLVTLGAEVRIIDDLSGSTLDNLNDILDSIRFIHGSILDPDSLHKAIAGADLVFHEAALASVPASIEDPVRYHEVNATGTLRVLEEARKQNVTRLVFASSSSVYGDLPSLPKRETDKPEPLSPYAMQKLTGEYLLDVWHRCYDLSTISLRYFNIFGPGQSANSAYAAVVAAFATALLKNQPPRIFGDGTATRDFTYIDNVVQANLRAGAIDVSTLQNNLKGRSPIFNVAVAVQTSILELASAMIRITEVDTQPAFEPERPGDVLHSLADISLAQEVLGYSPTVDLEEGLKPTMDWYRTQ